MPEARLIRADSDQSIAEAIGALRRGGLVAIPTDTVYGLAAELWNEQAVARIYAAKGRPEIKAIPVLLSGVEALPEVAQPAPDFVLELARRFWPGPLTVVLPRRPEIPEVVSPTATIGVRVPDQAFARELLAAAGPLAVTSANRSGRPGARTASEVLAELGDSIELVVDGGRTPGGVPSTVVDCTESRPRLLREGPISLEQIEAALEAAGAAQRSAR